MEVHLKNCPNKDLFRELIRRSKELEESYQKFCDQRDSLKSYNKELRHSIEEKNKVLADMIKKCNTLKKRAHSVKGEDYHELKQKRDNVLSKVTVDEARELYENIIQQILETKVKVYLKGLLTSTSKLSPQLDQRELYKIYGLLLSACRIKVEEVKHSMLHEGAFGKTGLEEYKAKSDILTHNMLKLLPPLLVICDEKQKYGFNKELYDTFRPTWDDTKDVLNIFYYRPVLVCGNQHSIAVKGLVGNCEKIQNHDQQDSSTIYQMPRRNSSYFGQQQRPLPKSQACAQHHCSGLSSITKQCVVCSQNIKTVQMAKQLKEDQYIHQECYVCCLCNKYIETTNALILDTGQLICFRCNKCCRCKQTIDEKSFQYQSAHMTAGYLWHKNCFKCSTCHTPLNPDAYCLKCGTTGL